MRKIGICFIVFVIMFCSFPLYKVFATSYTIDIGGLHTFTSYDSSSYVTTDSVVSGIVFHNNKTITVNYACNSYLNGNYVYVYGFDENYANGQLDVPNFDAFGSWAPPSSGSHTSSSLASEISAGHIHDGDTIIYFWTTFQHTHPCYYGTSGYVEAVVPFGFCSSTMATITITSFNLDCYNGTFVYDLTAVNFTPQLAIASIDDSGTTYFIGSSLSVTILSGNNYSVTGTMSNEIKGELSSHFDCALSLSGLYNGNLVLGVYATLYCINPCGVGTPLSHYEPSTLIVCDANTPVVNYWVCVELKKDGVFVSTSDFRFTSEIFWFFNKS